MRRLEQGGTPLKIFQLEDTGKYEDPGARHKILAMFRNNKGIRYGLNLVSECKEAGEKSGKATGGWCSF